MLVLRVQAYTYIDLLNVGFSKAKLRLSYISSRANILGDPVVLSLEVGSPVSATSSLSEQQDLCNDLDIHDILFIL